MNKHDLKFNLPDRKFSARNYLGTKTDRKIPALDSFFNLPIVAEKPYKTVSKKVHKAVVRVGRQFGQSRGNIAHNRVRVDLVSVENCVLALGHYKGFTPYLLAVLLLDIETIITFG